tara:strand:+ start:3121 stop:3909 length:789 start_codon:yes stop_codon:yes gene_type:complete
MLRKVFFSIKEIGFKKTIIKSINYFSKKNSKRRDLKKKIFETKSIKKRFNEIYQSNFWLGESRSGTGSELNVTKNIRAELPIIFKKFNIKKIFDAPCGDFNWMREFLKNYEIDYLGADIVKDIININKKKYENNKTKFKELDIIIDKLPKSDLMICRDCLFHFSNSDIFSFFNNFLSSEIKYLLITSHLNQEHKFENRDILTGDFRLIDFFSPPFNFKKNYLYSFDDRENEQSNYKQMYLFSKSQIESNLTKCDKKILKPGF